MSVATSTAIAISAGAAAGASIYGAHKASGAAKDAAKQQQQSAQQALALQREMYGQTRADLGPYREQGGQGLTALSALLGLPGPAPASSAPVGPTAPVPSSWHSMPPGATVTGHAVPRGTLPGTAPNFVTLRAPTGQLRAVPADQAAFYLARGASQV
jgi:hypothetical protein